MSSRFVNSETAITRRAVRRTCGMTTGPYIRDQGLKA